MSQTTQDQPFICPKCGGACDTWYDDEDESHRSECCNVWVFTACEACHGDCVVDVAEYECDWVNNAPGNIITCPDCKGTGRQYNPYKPEDWEKADELE